ncbi:MAG TPA: four helix bundle protein [Acidobacteriota bacterium]|nr:four helix bundle protein [Acidobacteriota bacterium]
MNEQEMKERTKEFAKRIIRLCRALPPTRESRLVGNQVFRAGTSVGANYWAACRGRSRADFVSKLGIALEEADESSYWLELIGETAMLPMEKVKPLRLEAGEITAILNKSILTARTNNETLSRRRTMK